MMSLRHKRGDTLDVLVAISEGGAPVDITGWTFRAQARHAAGNHAINMAVAVVGPGQIRLSADTVAAPVGTYVADIELTDALGRVLSTETWALQLMPDITHD